MAAATQSVARAASRKRRLAAPPWDAAVSQLMQGYSDRGVFRGQMLRGDTDVDSVHFKLRWHRNREFRIAVSRSDQTARVSEVLPGMEVKSPMYRDYKAFLASYQDGSRMAHRSVDADKVKIASSIRRGRVALELRVLDGDYEYAVKKLLVLIHETYLSFLMGPYDIYRVEKLGSDPDWGR